MFDEYTYLTRLEAADVPEFAQLLLQTAKNSSEAVQAGALLRCYFGNALYDRLYGLALRWEISQRDRAKSPQGNVVIIPGLLGSQLTSTDDTGQQEPLWLNLPNIAAGKLARLRLKADGRSAVDARYTVRATGILKRCYGELLLSLATQWHVHAFWYDWRKEFELAAAELQASIKRWYGEDEPVHLIAHASGGLVARWYLAQNHHRWLKAHKGQRSKLIMLGTPNHGSLAAPLAVAGLPTLFQWVDHLDADYQGHDYRAMVSSFPSLYQLFPAHALLADKEFADQLYDPATYGPDGIIPPGQLEKAKHSQAALASYKTAATPLQMLLVAGYNQPTIVGLSNLAQFRQVTRAGLNNPAATRAMLAGDDDLLKIGPDGDGFVPLELAELPGIATLYVEEGHGRLQANRILLEALPSLIHYDATAADRATRNLAALAASAGLHTQRPGLEHFAARFLKADEDKSSRLRDPQIVQEQIDQQTRSAWISQKERQARAARGPLQRLLTRDGRLQRPERVVEELQIMADLMTRTILSVEEAETGLRPSIAPFDPPKITLAIIQGDVFELDSQPTINDKLPVDALAIGHYQEPLTAGVIGQLDRAISQAVFDKEAVTEGTVARSAQASPTDLLLTQYLERGIIRSALGQLFFLPDLRQGDQAAGRLLAIVGMGPPGQFGEAELVVAVRDLCWSLGRMGKRHLVTVLLGTDQDNLPIYQAAAGWVRGIKYAITGEEGRSLEQITFVIRDPVKAKDFTQALQREATQLRDKQRMFIHPEQLQIQHWASQQPTSERAGERPPQPFSILPAARIFAQRTGDRFRFGAMTDSASIPERETRLDATLVAEANRQLIGLSRLGNQLDQGRYLEQLVVPDDLRKQLRAIGPLVMILDATTARVHWEMLADSVGVSDDDDGALERFWGIGRGLTRQLRTPFAPSPEYPPPQKRILRALVVADPAADAPLPWAAEEGVLVADLLERFNVAHAHTPNRIEVVRLIGPQQATRANVLKHLLNHSYDLLHFAGHSQYDAEMPERSGWIFSNNERLTAFEIARVDRVPTFIFSNSCDSGVTPERPELFDPALAPTFAETFFKQGVADFVCTAWPVNDLAGRDFALTLYAALLDLRSSTGNLSDIDSYGPGGGLMPLYQALRDARRAIAQEPYDLRTWGAYQHYGNPYFRFFALESMSQPPPAAQVESRPIAEDQTHPPPLEMPRIAPFEPLIQRGKLDHRAAVKIGIPPQRRLVETASFLKLDKARTEFGVSGKGLVVAVLDGGLNLQHKDFAGGERVLKTRFPMSRVDTARTLLGSLLPMAFMWGSPRRPKLWRSKSPPTSSKTTLTLARWQQPCTGCKNTRLRSTSQQFRCRWLTFKITRIWPLTICCGNS
jgi:hypothetical protein